MCRSVTKLQLRLLDPPLNHLVKGPNVMDLLDPFPGLVVLNSHSETRRISFVVGVVFTQERSWYGLSQACDGTVDQSLSNSRLVLRLHLPLGSLEGDNMRVELVVVLFQRLLLSGGIIAVESRLLPVAN